MKELVYTLNELFFPPIDNYLKYLATYTEFFSFSPSLFFFQPFNRVGFWCFQRSGIWIDCWNHWVLSGCWESKKRLWRWFWAYGDDFECTAQTVIEKEAWMFIDSYSTTQFYATYSIDKKLYVKIRLKFSLYSPLYHSSYNAYFLTLYYFFH